MKPASLTTDSFQRYTPESRELAAQHLTLLRATPLMLLPGYLEQIQSYSWQFPPERAALQRQLDWMSQPNGDQSGKIFAAFEKIAISPALEQFDWLNDPKGFIEALSAYLWQSRQIDLYHAAVQELFGKFPAPPVPEQPALVMAIIGRDAPPSSYPLFARMRNDGLHVQQLRAQGAREALLAAIEKRAHSVPQPYAHWYIDGGDPWPLQQASQITHFTYPQLQPIDDAVMKAMDQAVQEGTGPEMLSSRLNHLSPEALGAARITPDLPLQHLYTSLLTTGSGTQIYSTSFMQAAGIEVLRRAQPSTLLLRFAPRRRQASINDMIESRAVAVQTDPEGSLIDADMASFYAYLQMQKIPGGEKASFLAWVEDRNEAFVAGPSVTRGVEASTPMTMSDLLSLISA
ncbi:hypothetical protein [Silvibacterium acidisoli]|uniref:hypothetical protein n=1 Tax=Acidobacteriaceae bacterium ZG23-2 TaxID=2883246 RepID=UPI00406D20BB